MAVINGIVVYIMTNILLEYVDIATIINIRIDIHI